MSEWLRSTLGKGVWLSREFARTSTEQRAHSGKRRPTVKQRPKQQAVTNRMPDFPPSPSSVSASHGPKPDARDRHSDGFGTALARLVCLRVVAASHRVGGASA